MTKESDALINRGDDSPSKPFQKILQPCMAEFLGMCLFVFVGCLTVQDPLGIAKTSPPSAPAVAVGHGFAIAFFIVAFGNISGAHLNPAVTLGILLSGAITPVMAAAYVIAQLTGAMVGAGFVRAVLPLEEFMAINGGAHILNAPVIGPGPGILCEILLTTVLVLTVLLSAVDDHNKSSLAPLAIGFAVTVCILAGINTTGASMNPARSFGPAVALSVYMPSVWTYHYVYWVGPLLGAVIAAIFYRIIFACPEKRFFCKD
ncbi:aquaporin-8-like isoform X1 [Haliotis rufescens]|uniref:aquaporin-8-like isoform X1 n=1 Tax=Haliotis rufescens TaxID=6454 RepID=UPI00201EEF35|nr:aquaporin-8-like isoform X1 [Haliotis rufescens]XP_048248157.1 aquaporin-8-like isoform X1 [Haliotis rufescens]XP_048248158.1 aquaporin-8-like isoform X1 [Haliotis rufescens]XP_048248159.1 aquaporin-8-like isoform X1 [Haliotis rufescens]XP_048248160.1 aquaporin-8-like isoform X1 [Haliotis rufescens]